MWQGSATFFSVKGKVVNIFVFAGSVVSATVAQFCSSSIKSVIDKTSMNGLGYVPIKLYETRQKGQICPEGYS